MYNNVHNTWIFGLPVLNICVQSVMFARHGSECTGKKVNQGYKNHELKWCCIKWIYCKISR